LIITSRNGLTETLMGVNTPTRRRTSRCPASRPAAWVYITGRLNKTVQLLAWEQGGNDVVYGGLGDDFLHAGAGNDAVSGAEALAAYYIDTPVTNINPLVYDPATRKLAATTANCRS
jgi:Ca2+-binding RTX toxin-like protein